MIDWEKQFSVVSINRADLTEFGLTDEQIALFTDQKMEELAETMQTAYYLRHPFWTDFRHAIQEVMHLDVRKGKVE